ncbi:hypothetical protein AVEN_118647-1 [Araneus ventricosus]|uniref:Uncharacterized protein n=1 Tax=Araneus ventricosus TaxID=182803 RepID=A0A4Y2AYJ2_ARAVE|nr:hypothetical protein AVEN_118647-1 [Araneus ventricosus]
MHSSVIFLFVLSLVVVVFAEKDSNGRRRRGPPNNPANIMFPACKPFVDAMEKSGEDLFEADQIGHRACKEENSEDCISTDAMKVRCSVPDPPSEECMVQLTDFLQGNTCNE